MAVIEWPTGLKILSSEISAVNPAQFIHRVPATSDVQVLSLGPGIWQGVCTFTADPGSNIAESFLAEISTPQNTVDMPLSRPTIETSSPIAITAVTSNLVTLASEPTGLKKNAYVKSGLQVFIITSVSMSATPQIALWPYKSLTTSDTIDSADTIRVRTRGTSGAPRVGQFQYGDYEFQWEQSLN